MLKEIQFPVKPDKETLIIVCGPNNFERDMVKIFKMAGFEYGVNLIKL